MAPLRILLTLWFRNTWKWQNDGAASALPCLRLDGTNVIRAEHPTLGSYQFAFDTPAEVLFTENETNIQRLSGVPNPASFVKDAFHDYVISGRREAVNAQHTGTKCAPNFVLMTQPGETRQLRLRLVSADTAPEGLFGKAFDTLFAER